MASALAWSSVKLPEICTVPPNDVNDDWVGWVMGAEMTWPSRSMPMMAWNCCWASVSHWLAPAEVRLRLTDHCPLLSCADADLIWAPVRPAGPRTYRSVPDPGSPGRSTVSFFPSLADGVDLYGANWGSAWIELRFEV